MVIWTWCKLQIESSGVKFSYVNRSEKKLHGPFIYIMQCHLAISDLLGPLAPPRAPKVEKTPQNGTFQLKTAISRSFLADLIKFVWIHSMPKQRNRHLAYFSRPFQHSFAKTLRPSSGKNKRLSEFWITDPRSAPKNGRFDILTSKTKKIFEIMVIWTWSKLQIGSSGVIFSYVDGSEKILRGPFIYIMQCPLAISDLSGPPSPPKGPES